ncbi:hypothetical protein [Enterococcus pallens]|uniref:Uncharacterized protein n=1 Tax=Enterococcus pallens ATCC BAA-351 TaxID=1158607 RepID=R2SET2_9ENTE|nr:hypothetical protein [Enterococcus pallens]EOH86694.1 hypothetical protein UAU_05139 [Enterococcus pallens ATCC BAA-351]EOU18490.1 hypothetical protein I588_03484 [Enterococcus pallens ATCC BAA-351]OJG76509.1 hypothetical protein RV10_GL003646 [Enterococcus pallens]
MAASGVGQFSINVKSNLKDFYGQLTKAQRTMKELTDKKNQLQVDSSQLDKLRDKSQRIAAEMRELRQQKTEIKLGMKNVEDADKELKNIDQRIASLSRQKLEVDAEIQPIRTANAELYKVEQEIDRINGQKVEIDIGEMSGQIGDGLDNLSSKVIGVVKAIGAISFSGMAAGVGILKEAVNAASDLEQNLGGVEKLFGDSANAVVKNSDSAFRTAGVSKNEYLEQATSFSASLISSLGGDQEKAAEYVDKALIDMSDNVNTFGTNANLVQNAYEGFAKGNYTMLDNLKLGFGGTQEGAKQLINTYGGLDHEVTDMAEVTFPLLIESIHNAQQAMNISGTTAKEAATTYEGSSKMMKAAWNDFLATGNTEGLAESVPIYLENLDSKLKEMTPKIIEGVKKLVKELPPKLKPVIEDIRKILEESLNSIFGEDFTKNFVEGMAPFTDIIKKVFEMLSKSTEGKKPDLSWVGSVIPNLLKLALGLKSASLVFKGISFASGLGLKLPSFKGLGSFGKSTKEFKAVGIEDLKSLGLKMLTIAGISANIYFAAKALQQVQQVGDLGDLQPKLLAIAEAVIGMGILAAAVGFIAEKKPDLLISGLATIALISADIWLAAKALQQVAKIDSDFGSMQAKIGQIALSIAEMGVLALAVGAFMSTGIGAAALAAGLVALIGIAGTLALVATAVSYLGNLEIDKEAIKRNLEAITETLQAATSLTVDQSLIEQISNLITQVINLAVIGTMLAIGLELRALQDIELNKEKIMTNVKAIQECLFYLDLFDQGTSINDLINKVHDLLSNLIDIGIIAEFLVIAKELEALQDIELDKKKIESNIKTIKELVKSISSGSLAESIKNFLSGGIKAGSLATAIALFGELKSIGDVLVKIQKLGLTEDSLQEQIQIIKNAIDSISSFATDDIVNNLSGLSAALDQIVVNLTQKFPPEFNKLGQKLAEELNKGFKNKLNLKSILSDELKNLSTDGANTAGTRIAEAINSSMKNTLNIGDTIRTAIENALAESYSTKIDVDLVTTETKKSTSKKKSKTSKDTKASGGLISVKSGYKAEIQDSPEKPLLANGEYVIPEKIVDAVGMPFLEKLRSGQISRTFAGLAQSVSHTTSSVVNNVYHNNNTQNLNLYTSGNQDAVLAANRRFRMA